jgi:hypothetical protein
MDQLPTDAAEADRLALRRLDEIAELIARAILRALAADAQTPTPTTGKKGDTAKAAPQPATPDGAKSR